MCESPHNDPHRLYSRARCHGNRCINSSRCGCVFLSKVRVILKSRLSQLPKIWLTPPLCFEFQHWNMNEYVHWRLECFFSTHVKYFLRHFALQLYISLFPSPLCLPLPSVTLCRENFMSGSHSRISKAANEMWREQNRDKTLRQIHKLHTLYLIV